MKTSELTGLALNWAVAKCEGAEYKEGFLFWYDHEGAKRQIKPYPYSTDWAQGGPIIEREGLTLDQWDDYPRWRSGNSYGQTPLIAAMRCYVASKLGDEVDVASMLADIECRGD